MDRTFDAQTGLGACKRPGGRCVAMESEILNYVRELQITLSALGAAAVRVREVREPSSRELGRPGPLRGLEWSIELPGANQGRHQTYRLPLTMIGQTAVRIGAVTFDSSDLDRALEHLTRSVVSRFYRSPNPVFELRPLGATE